MDPQNQKGISSKREEARRALMDIKKPEAGKSNKESGRNDKNQNQQNRDQKPNHHNFKKKIEDIYNRHQQDIKKRKEEAQKALTDRKQEEDRSENRYEQNRSGNRSRLKIKNNKWKVRNINPSRNERINTQKENGFNRQNPNPKKPEQEKQLIEKSFPSKNKIQLDYRGRTSLKQEPQNTRKNTPVTKFNTEKKRGAEGVIRHQTQPASQSALQNKPSFPVPELKRKTKRQDLSVQKNKENRKEDIKKKGGVSKPTKYKLRNEWGVQIKGPVSPIRTYQSDIASTVKKEEESVTSIREKEASRARSRGDKPRFEKKRDDQKKKGRRDKFIKVIATTFTVIVAGAGLYAGYTFYTSNFSSARYGQGEAGSTNTSLPSNVQKTISLSGRSVIKESIRRMIGDTPSSAGIVSIEITKNNGELATAQDILRNIEANIPEHLERNVESYMLGIHSSQNQKTPFLILNTGSFNRSLSGMLDWEGSLAQDMSNLFPELSTENPGSWEDVVVNNLDTRIQNVAGDQLIYTVTDGGAVIISMEKEALVTITEMHKKEIITNR